MAVVLLILGAGALYLAVSALRTAFSRGEIGWLTTVRRAENPRLFGVHLGLAVLLLLAGMWAVGRAAMGLG